MLYRNLSFRIVEKTKVQGFLKSFSPLFLGRFGIKGVLSCLVVERKEMLDLLSIELQAI
jgi:hypothetical protein